jgi:hypothetical protein
MVSKHGSKICEMTWLNIPSTFVKIYSHLNCFWNIFVFLSTQVHYIHFHKYTPISQWSEIVSFMITCLGSISNIICKNIVKIFQKFEVRYTQTCTSLESSTYDTPKGVNVMCFHPTIWHLFFVGTFYTNMPHNTKVLGDCKLMWTNSIGLKVHLVVLNCNLLWYHCLHM